MSGAKKKATESIRIHPEDEGRLDRFLAMRFPDWSRTSLQRLINGRFILVDEHPASPKHKLKTGQTVSIKWPKADTKAVPVSAEPVPFPILYEDDVMFVIDKPAGVVVHPSAGHTDGKSLIELVQSKVSGGPWPDEMRPGLVHRLDRDTSGVIVLAKNPDSHRKLSAQFSRRNAKKTYVAIVEGSVKPTEGLIESHLSRHPGKRQRFAVSASGRWASTKFKVKERVGGFTIIELYPLTGRTHQIRIHLSHFGHPIVGDHVYGSPDPDREFAPRHMLHAYSLELDHPETGKKLYFESKLPTDFQQCLKLIRLNK